MSTEHQRQQRKVIDSIAKAVQSNTLSASTVAPAEDYECDPRLCLTSVHFPRTSLLDQIERTLIEPLRKAGSTAYFYPRDSLHITIKNVRVINNPPHFTQQEVGKAKEMFAAVVPRHSRFNVYFYRLLSLPNSVALMGTTDPALDRIVLDLDGALREAGIPDDKVYVNSRYFFCNMTLCRFSSPPSEEFRQTVDRLSRSLTLPSYTVDSVTLLTCNAALLRRRIRGSWKLNERID